MSRALLAAEADVVALLVVAAEEDAAAVVVVVSGAVAWRWGGLRSGWNRWQPSLQRRTHDCSHGHFQSRQRGKSDRQPELSVLRGVAECDEYVGQGLGAGGITGTRRIQLTLRFTY